MAQALEPGVTIGRYLRPLYQIATGQRPTTPPTRPAQRQSKIPACQKITHTTSWCCPQATVEGGELRSPAPGRPVRCSCLAGIYMEHGSRACKHAPVTASRCGSGSCAMLSVAIYSRRMVGAVCAVFVGPRRLQDRFKRIGSVASHYTNTLDMLTGPISTFTS